VAINGSGDTIAVGALHNDGEAEAGRYGCVNCRGSVRILKWSSSREEWLQRGNDIDGEQDKDFFGSSVALNAAGNMIVIGAPQTGDSSKRGLTYVYKWNNKKERWQKRGSCIEGTDGGDVFGSSVSISNPGETIAVGAYLHDGKNGDNDGHVRVFDWNKDTDSWSQRGEDIEGENKNDSSGYSVALSADGKTVASGARDTDDGAGYQAGHVRVFGWKNNDGEPTVCPDVFAPLFCEGIKYDNSCIAKEAGFMENQCFEGLQFCLTVSDPVWCQGSINIQVVQYDNVCLAIEEGFSRSQCTGQEPPTPDECEDPENTENINPLFCEGIEYDNSCIAKEAGFMETQCFQNDDGLDQVFCLDDVDLVWCQGSINIQVVQYDNSCIAMLEGFGRSQCTGQDPSTPDDCEDDALFRKGNQNQNCAEYLENKGKRRCKKGHQGKKVYDFCVKTCNKFGLGDCTSDEDDDSDDYNFELDN